MKGAQRRLPLLLGLIVLPVAVMVGGLLIAGSSPDAPQVTDTNPVRLAGGASTGPGSGASGSAQADNATPPADSAAAQPGDETGPTPDTPRFQPYPPGTAPGGSGPRATQPGAGPTTQVRPPVQRRPAPVPYDHDDDHDHDDDDDD